MSQLQNKRVLLIGGAGFIGHNLALHLKDHGADVSIIDGLNVNNLMYVHSTDIDMPNREMYIGFINERLNLLRHASIPLHVVDARNYFKISKVISTYKPTHIVLLAAVAHANRSNKDPYETFDHSLRTLENALDAIKAEKYLERFIYFSSSMIYGNFNDQAVTEDSPCNPLGVYGNLKFSGERMVLSYHQAFEVPYTIVRPSALYGERCISRRVGQVFIESAIMGQSINIQGDGSDRLDFTYIGDLVAGVRNIIESPKSLNETFNITYGQGRSIAEMAEIIKENFPEIKINYKPKDKLMPDRGTLSVAKAADLIGYNPQYPLEKGYVNYINWYKSMFTDKKEFASV